MLEAAEAVRAGRLAGGDGLLQGREPLPVRRLRKGSHARSATPRSPSTSPRCRRSAPKAENENAKGAEARANEKALEQPAVGPFPASIESLETEPAFRAATTANDPNAATVVYSTDVNFPSDGEWRIAARGQGRRRTDRDRCCRASIVGESEAIPRPGQKAPLIHTPTAADVGGDLSKITTRIPPDTQNKVDYADVLGKEPIVLLFATPQFCQSRVCGPVVDVAEQVKQLYGDKAAFIHMEIYEDNDPSEDRAAAGEGLPPAERAVAVRDRPRRQGQGR